MQWQYSIQVKWALLSNRGRVGGETAADIACSRDPPSPTQAVIMSTYFEQSNHTHTQAFTFPLSVPLSSPPFCTGQWKFDNREVRSNGGATGGAKEVGKVEEWRHAWLVDVRIGCDEDVCDSG